jgi:uncharacterized protein YodC (DUF2158 family)
MAAFKKGDTVQLKSGGPKMTVENDHTYQGDVTVVWFAGSKMESKDVDPESLQLFVEPESKK